MLGALISLTLAAAIIWPQSSQYGMNIAIAYVWLGTICQIMICGFWALVYLVEEVTPPNSSNKLEAIILGNPNRLRWFYLSFYIGLLVVMAANGATFTVICSAMALTFYHGLRKSISEKADK
jgi:hypothetical protein